jgi:hypothetical protein
MTEELTYNKHRHILNAIDVLSKKAYSRSPVTPAGTAPTAAQTLKLAKEIFDEIKAEHGSYPKRLQTDNGAHFQHRMKLHFDFGFSFLLPLVFPHTSEPSFITSRTNTATHHRPHQHGRQQTPQQHTPPQHTPAHTLL